MLNIYEIASLWSVFLADTLLTSYCFTEKKADSCLLKTFFEQSKFQRDHRVDLIKVVNKCINFGSKGSYMPRDVEKIPNQQLSHCGILSLKKTLS